MRPSVLLKTISLVLLSSFLTVCSALGQGGPVDRRAFVTAAYEGFYGTLYVLSGSDAFLDRLTVEEREQFVTLGSAIIRPSFRLAPGDQPGASRTSNHSNVALRFSDRHEDFIIAPDKTERTAKMNGDIWFNLNIINDPSTSFGLLDSYQILFHEFGHVLGDAKDQALIDQIAAKMRTYLESYFKEQTLQADLKVQSLVLPYLVIEGRPADLQPEPMVVFEISGQAKASSVTGLQFFSPKGQFGSLNPQFQAYTRLSLTPTFSIYDSSTVLAAWAVETKHTLIEVVGSRFNYLDLYTNSAKVLAQQAVAPAFSLTTMYQMISGPDFTQGSLVRMKSFAENPTNFPVALDDKWIEPLNVKPVAGGYFQVEGVIENSEAVDEIALLIQVKNDVLQVPGDAVRETGNQYRIRFLLPDATENGSKVYVSGIAINSKKTWKLPERTTIAERVAERASSLSLTSIEVWDGVRWLPSQSITDTQIASSSVKLRFQFANAVTELNHIEISWLVQDVIRKNGRDVGSRFRSEQDLIPKSKLTQTLQNGSLSVEFESSKLSHYSSEVAGRAGITTSDTGLRAIEKIQFVDGALTSMALGTRMAQGTWRSVFHLNRPRGLSCEQNFR